VDPADGALYPSPPATSIEAKRDREFKIGMIVQVEPWIVSYNTDIEENRIE
jgi:hypothetical protein